MNERLNDGEPPPVAIQNLPQALPQAQDPEPSSKLVSAPTQTADLMTSVQRTPLARRLASRGENKRLVACSHASLEWRGGTVCGCLGRLWFPPAAEPLVKQMCGQGGQLSLSGGEGCLVSKSNWLSDLERNI